MKYKILIVDDEPANLRMLERLFAGPYDVLTALSGAEALELLMTHDVALILSDQRMPVMSGIEFLKKAAELRINTVRIILTGYTDIETVVESINSGVVYRYIAKPWSNTDLQQTVIRGMEHYETLKRQHQLNEEVQRMQHRVKATVRGFVNLVLEMFDLKGPGIRSHARRTAKYATAMGKALNLSESEVERLYLAAILHEIAHIRMPARLMSRATEVLCDDEIRLIEDRSQEGLKLLAEMPDFDEVARTISFQHDQFDGFGSLHHLAGDQIPLDARIIAIVNAYDEMREPNTMTQAFTHTDALAELHGAAGQKYDPALVGIFCGLKFEDEIPVRIHEPVAAMMPQL